MSRLNIPPTKSNQLRISHDLEMASEGFQLLDQKREILVLELMRLLDRVRVAQKRLDTARQQAYGTLKKALTKNGFNRMQRVASGVRYEHSVRTQFRVTAGVRTPEISVDHGAFARQFGFADTDSLTDETMRDFLQLLRAIGEMAQIETSVWLLAHELKRTQRRVNALEQIFIPDFRDTLKYIDDLLESRDLETFSLMKRVKAMREKTIDG